jgi:hypothetical protein
MPCHRRLVDDDPFVFASAGDSARVVERPVIDGRAGDQLDARCRRLNGPGDDRLVDPFVVVVRFF